MEEARLQGGPGGLRGSGDKKVEIRQEEPALLDSPGQSEPLQINIRVLSKVIGPFEAQTSEFCGSSESRS